MISYQEEELNTVRSTAVLGLTISENLKWDSHIGNVTQKARGRINILEKLITNGFDDAFILEVYFKEIRSVLEYGAVLFHHALTIELSDKIEGIQRLVLRLLATANNLKLSYMEACILFSVEPLILRRDSLCERFVKRIPRNEVHADLFKKRNNCYNLHDKRKYQEYKSYHRRHFDSPLVALTRLANKVL